MSRKEITEFLKDFDGYVFKEHMDAFKQYLLILDERDYQKDTAAYSKNGFHFQSCPWSDDNIMQRSEFCRCSLFERKMNYLDDLINKYYLLTTRFYIPLPKIS